MSVEDAGLLQSSSQALGFRCVTSTLQCRRGKECFAFSLVLLVTLAIGNGVTAGPSLFQGHLILGTTRHDTRFPFPDGRPAKRQYPQYQLMVEVSRRGHLHHFLCPSGGLSAYSPAFVASRWGTTWMGCLGLLAQHSPRVRLRVTGKKGPPDGR